MASYEPWDNERLDRILQEKGGTVKRIGDVIGVKYKLKAKCLVCGHEWLATPQTLANAGCPECAKEAKRGVHRKAKYKYAEVKKIIEDSGYKLQSTEYINNKQPLTFVDVEHGTTITTSFRNFLLTYKKEK